MDISGIKNMTFGFTHTYRAMVFCLRPSKKKNMFHVRVFQKKEEEGLFIFYFLFQDGRHSLLKCQISIVFSTAEIHKT